MPTSSDSDFRPLAHRILLVQIVVGAAVALVCLALGGGQAALSALAGAATGVIANLYMTFRGLRPARPPYDVASAQQVLGRMYRGQAIKVAVTVALFIAATRLPHVSWPALLAAYGAILVAFWWISVASAAARQRRDSAG